MNTEHDKVHVRRGVSKKNFLRLITEYDFFKFRIFISFKTIQSKSRFHEIFIGVTFFMQNHLKMTI